MNYQPTTNNRFFIVDVFAIDKYTGNQLAVVLNADNLTSEQMQQIAREMNISRILKPLEKF